MRVVIAQVKHETSTYSPVPTPLSRFTVGGTVPLEGRAAYDAYKRTGSAIGAVIDLAESADAEISIPVASPATRHTRTSTWTAPACAPARRFSRCSHDVVECAGTGVCTSDYSTLKFNKVRRPIYPLDAF